MFLTLRNVVIAIDQRWPQRAPVPPEGCACPITEHDKNMKI